MQPTQNPTSLLLLSLGAALFVACSPGADPGQAGASEASHAADSSTAKPAAAEDHSHAEDSLGTLSIGELQVELAQGHGGVAAGKEGHLVVKLPYSDSGATRVRAWIGSADRTLSYVGKGTYAPSHDDYDVHATAPDPLPVDPMWWIEIERPDGSKSVGSKKPLFD